MTQEPCHHGVLGCVLGLMPSPLCPECQGDVERGVGCQREHAAQFSAYKVEVDRLGTAVALALVATSWAACREALGVAAVAMREAG